MAAPQHQNVFIRLGAQHQLELFEDADASIPLSNFFPQGVDGHGNGTIQFHFIMNFNPGHHNQHQVAGGAWVKHIETGDVLVIPQVKVVAGPNNSVALVRDTPFRPTNRRVHFLPDPGITKGDPNNANGTLKTKTTPAGAEYISVTQKIKIIDIGNANNDGPYKYAIGVLSDQGADFDVVDPTVVINP